MVFNMLKLIDNSIRDERFSQFNTKIEQYNRALENQNLPEALQLLEEIYYFYQQLTTLALNSLFDPSSDKNLRVIFDWTGVSQELSHWLAADKIPISALSTEMTFNTLTGIHDTDQTLKQWRRHTQPKWYNAAATLWDSVKNPKIYQYIEHLLDLHDKHGLDSLEYFYGLQQIKNTVLQKINFTPLSPAKLIRYQHLLKQINGQISAVIRNVPSLQERYSRHESIALSLRQDFQRASPDEKEKIATIFSSFDFNQQLDPEMESEMTEEEITEYSEQMAKNKEEIHGILPNLQKMYVHKISSANNKTWVLQQDEIGERTVLRVEQPSPAILIQRLRSTPVNEFLSNNYANCISDYNVYPIVISEFAPDGDLRSNRKDHNKFNKEGVILQQAVNDVTQLAIFCETMLEHGAMHPDIKLSNFLLSPQNHIFITDMKAFKSVNEAGKILARDTIVTPPFAPPEYNKSLKARHLRDGKPIELDADKFMSYQLGLALYDHLVLPSDPEWSNKKLDFSHSIFANPQGKKLQTLIKVLTLENPDHRMGIKYAIKQLESLQKPMAKLHMALQVKTPPPDTGRREPEDMDLVLKSNSQTVVRSSSETTDISSSPEVSSKNPNMK